LAHRNGGIPPLRAHSFAFSCGPMPPVVGHVPAGLIVI
jgi:hypothetical protein